MSWIAEESHSAEWDGTTIWEDDMVVAHVVPDQHDRHREHAELICRAVNNHVELVGALRWLLDDLADADEDHNRETGDTYDSVAHARQVLIKLKGTAE